MVLEITKHHMHAIHWEKITQNLNWYSVFVVTCTFSASPLQGMSSSMRTLTGITKETTCTDNLHHNTFTAATLHTPARGGVTCDDGSALQADPRTLVVPLSPPSPVAPCRAHVWWPPCHASPRSPHSGTTLPTWSAPAAVTGFRTVLLSSPAAGPHAAVHPASRSGSCSWRSPASVDCSHAWS